MRGSFVCGGYRGLFVSLYIYKLCQKHSIHQDKLINRCNFWWPCLGRLFSSLKQLWWKMVAFYARLRKAFSHTGPTLSSPDISYYLTFLQVIAILFTRYYEIKSSQWITLDIPITKEMRQALWYYHRAACSVSQRTLFSQLSALFMQIFTFFQLQGLGVLHVSVVIQFASFVARQSQVAFNIYPEYARTTSHSKNDAILQDRKFWYWNIHI